MTDYNAQMAKLSDDMVGQLYLAAYRALVERRIKTGDLIRSQVRRLDTVCWIGKNGDSDMHFGIVSSVNQKTFSIIEGNRHNPEVPIGMNWKIDHGLVIPLGQARQTGLAKKEIPLSTHVMQTDVQDSW